jgi:hypothetical protein
MWFCESRLIYELNLLLHSNLQFIVLKQHIDTKILQIRSIINWLIEGPAHDFVKKSLIV